MEKVPPKHNQRIFRICLTGGPCAGKTAARTILAEMFPAEKYILYFVPEAATYSVSAGVDLLQTVSTSAGRRVYTESCLRLQMQAEDFFFNIARVQDRDVIIICDRGAVDGLAYTPKPIQEQMLAENGWTLHQIREKRYDAVIHLVTTADGAEGFYSLQNNGARSESAAQAKELDKKTQDVWKGHPGFIVVDNEGISDFRQKIERAYNHISRLFGFTSKPVFSTSVKLAAPVRFEDLLPELMAERFTLHTSKIEAVETDEQIEVCKRVCVETKANTYFKVIRKTGTHPNETFESFQNLDEISYGAAIPTTISIVDLVIFVHYQFLVHVTTELSETAALQSTVKAVTGTAGKKFTLPTFLGSAA